METDEYARMDAAESRMWWYRALHSRLLAALVPVRGRVLDAGCGTGGFLRVLATARPELERFGCEWDCWAAGRAQEKSGARVVRSSVTALPFHDSVFDAVVSADVLCHDAVEPRTALEESARVLKPGGMLVVNMPAFMWLHSAHDRRVRNARRVTVAALRCWLDDAGFAAGQVHYWNGLLLPLMVAHRKILARRPESHSDVAAFPPWLDAMLHAVTALERALPWPPPAGGSVFATAFRSPA